jgi:regulatory protein
MQAPTERQQALKLLSRREHTLEELKRKLARLGSAPDTVENTVSELAGEGLQSDARFVEQFIAYRSQRGYGPLYLINALRERGVSDELVREYVNPNDAEWDERLAQLRLKRFGDELPKDTREYARQQRFLRYRGFTDVQVRRVLGEIPR